MKVRTLVGIVIATTSCSHSRDPASTRGPSAEHPDYCAMAAAVLTETIKSNREQPYGLEDACVDEMAARSGKIYVDARFMDANGASVVPVPSCTAQKYVIRFDPKRFEPSPAPGVVLLLVSAPSAKGREFNARIEDPNWPAKPAGTAALSQCGSAFGVLTAVGSHWAARVVPPPREPDDL